MHDDEEKKMFIYMTTNLIDEKKYIGQHHGFADDNYLGSGTRLRHAIKKHGKENFKRDIICYCYSQEELDEKEIFWIEHYNAIKDNNFYNIAGGGNGTSKCAGLTEEEELERRRKISIASTGKNNPNYGKRIPKEKHPMYGKHHSEESKEKMRKAALGRKLPTSQRQKISLNNPNAHSVDAYTENGTFIKHFRTLRDANSFIGLNRRSTGRLIEAIKENKLYHGYYFKDSE